MDTIEGFIIYNVGVVILAIVLTVRNVRFFRNPDFLDYSLRTQFPGTIWVKKIGIEKAIKLSRKYFIPAGFFMCFLLFAVSIRNFVLMVALFLG